MRNARLRHRLEIESRAPLGGSFEPSAAWQPLAVVWAEKRDPAGKEVSAGLQSNAIMTVVFRTHYRDDITPECRALLGSRVFDIKAATNPDGRGQWLLLHCVEHQSRGD
jgi:SPP1 family predicted phage head-tail adaptor